MIVWTLVCNGQSISKVEDSPKPGTKTIEANQKSENEEKQENFGQRVGS